MRHHEKKQAFHRSEPFSENKREITARTTRKRKPVKALAERIRGGGEWDRDVFDLLPRLITQTSAWKLTKLGLILKSERGKENILTAEKNIILKRLNKNHYQSVSQDGHIVDVPPGADCFFSAIYASLQEPEFHTEARILLGGAGTNREKAVSDLRELIAGSLEAGEFDHSDDDCLQAPDKCGFGGVSAPSGPVSDPAAQNKKNTGSRELHEDAPPEEKAEEELYWREVEDFYDDVFFELGKRHFTGEQLVPDILSLTDAWKASGIILNIYTDFQTVVPSKEPEISLLSEKGAYYPVIEGKPIKEIKNVHAFLTAIDYILIQKPELESKLHIAFKTNDKAALMNAFKWEISSYILNNQAEIAALFLREGILTDLTSTKKIRPPIADREKLTWSELSLLFIYASGLFKNMTSLPDRPPSVSKGTLSVSQWIKDNLQSKHAILLAEKIFKKGVKRRDAPENIIRQIQARVASLKRQENACAETALSHVPGPAISETAEENIAANPGESVTESTILLGAAGALTAVVVNNNIGDAGEAAALVATGIAAGQRGVSVRPWGIFAGIAGTIVLAGGGIAGWFGFHAQENNRRDNDTLPAQNDARSDITAEMPQSSSEQDVTTDNDKVEIIHDSGTGKNASATFAELVRSLNTGGCVTKGPETTCGIKIKPLLARENTHPGDIWHADDFKKELNRILFQSVFFKQLSLTSESKSFLYDFVEVFEEKHIPSSSENRQGEILLNVHLSMPGMIFEIRKALFALCRELSTYRYVADYEFILILLRVVNAIDENLAGYYDRDHRKKAYVSDYTHLLSTLESVNSTISTLSEDRLLSGLTHFQSFLEKNKPDRVYQAVATAAGGIYYKKIQVYENTHQGSVPDHLLTHKAVFKAVLSGEQINGAVRKEEVMHWMAKAEYYHYQMKNRHITTTQTILIPATETSATATIKSTDELPADNSLLNQDELEDYVSAALIPDEALREDVSTLISDKNTLLSSIEQEIKHSNLTMTDPQPCLQQEREEQQENQETEAVIKRILEEEREEESQAGNPAGRLKRVAKPVLRIETKDFAQSPFNILTQNSTIKATGELNEHYFVTCHDEARQEAQIKDSRNISKVRISVVVLYSHLLLKLIGEMKKNRVNPARQKEYYWYQQQANRVLAHLILLEKQGGNVKNLIPRYEKMMNRIQTRPPLTAQIPADIFLNGTFTENPVTLLDQTCLAGQGKQSWGYKLAKVSAEKYISRLQTRTNSQEADIDIIDYYSHLMWHLINLLQDAQEGKLKQESKESLLLMQKLLRDVINIISNQLYMLAPGRVRKLLGDAREKLEKVAAEPFASKKSVSLENTLQSLYTQKMIAEGHITTDEAGLFNVTADKMEEMQNNWREENSRRRENIQARGVFDLDSLCNGLLNRIITEYGNSDPALINATCATECKVIPSGQTNTGLEGGAQDAKNITLTMGDILLGRNNLRRHVFYCPGSYRVQQQLSEANIKEYAREKIAATVDNDPQLAKDFGVIQYQKFFQGLSLAWIKHIVLKSRPDKKSQVVSEAYTAFITGEKKPRFLQHLASYRHPDNPLGSLLFFPDSHRGGVLVSSLATGLRYYIIHGEKPITEKKLSPEQYRVTRDNLLEADPEFQQFMRPHLFSTDKNYSENTLFDLIIYSEFSGKTSLIPHYQPVFKLSETEADLESWLEKNAIHHFTEALMDQLSLITTDREFMSGLDYQMLRETFRYTEMIIAGATFVFGPFVSGSGAGVMSAVGLMLLGGDAALIIQDILQAKSAQEHDDLIRGTILQIMIGLSMGGAGMAWNRLVQLTPGIARRFFSSPAVRQYIARQHIKFNRLFAGAHGSTEQLEMRPLLGETSASSSFSSLGTIDSLAPAAAYLKKTSAPHIQFASDLVSQSPSEVIKVMTRDKAASPAVITYVIRVFDEKTGSYHIIDPSETDPKFRLMEENRWRSRKAMFATPEQQVTLEYFQVLDDAQTSSHNRVTGQAAHTEYLITPAVNYVTDIKEPDAVIHTPDKSIPRDYGIRLSGLQKKLNTAPELREIIGTKQPMNAHAATTMLQHLVAGNDEQSRVM
ncbi:hypothetical protein ACGVWS_15075, partial [Enterobacteriaceae bacterium LUAb1]